MSRYVLCWVHCACALRFARFVLRVARGTLTLFSKVCPAPRSWSGARVPLRGAALRFAASCASCVALCTLRVALCTFRFACRTWHIDAVQCVPLRLVRYALRVTCPLALNFQPFMFIVLQPKSFRQNECSAGPCCRLRLRDRGSGYGRRRIRPKRYKY